MSAGDVALGVREGHSYWMGSGLNGAVMTDDGLYRYRLWRTQQSGINDNGRVCFIMLNPSTANHFEDDPTIRRCLGFAARWGFSGIEVVNLFAYRATFPKNLRRVDDPIGPDNDMHIERAVLSCGRVVLAWGCRPEANIRWRANRVRDLLELIASRGGLPRVVALEAMKNGYRHPLMARYDRPTVTLPFGPWS